MQEISIKRRTLGATAILLAMTFAFPVAAQSWPTKPIRLLVGIGAGGTGDQVARLYGQKLSEALNASVIVENRPGAYQISAIRALQQAAPDGYTLYLGNGSSLAQSPGIRKDLGYDPQKDFTWIAPVGVSSAVLFVNPQLPVRTFKELVAYSIANPDKLNYGSAGGGTADHLKIEYLKAVTGMKAVHVPYKSGTEVAREVAAGNVHFGLTTAQTPVPMVQAGKLRAIAVTAPQALPHLPGVPGSADVDVPGFSDIEPYTFYGLVGPAGLPAPIVAKLNEAMKRIGSMADVQSRMRDILYVEPMTGSPEAIRQIAAREMQRAAGIGERISIPTN
ncbi:tripartite tricarboxylate transporter substrate binding protein [Hydrogenophaga sp.]|uniref:Bug family tripartite tricarboxylate transporter substrate binding protein n=1 Tax=Hydrogenophaga sp. TaxID=1904254 RepID=UPI00271A05AA|nr:tripartite tricarboxylate transporter substrate binding protein [Hydrogenophaga sp.]MDO9439167.1 tripartite tricarboxylate transporter substrate binding protein [Hydrogenophaga sp.]